MGFLQSESVHYAYSHVVSLLEKSIMSHRVTNNLLFRALSGHGIPRSFRHMDGFGIHTFRFVNDDGESKLVKYHFKTKQGLASLVWSEALVLNGQNPDYHREDLFKAIESGNFPEWEVGVQIMDESDALRWGFDLLDPTKIVPVELVPITPIGKFVLNRNTMNYFAETEQAMVNFPPFYSLLKS